MNDHVWTPGNIALGEALHLVASHGDNYENPLNEAREGAAQKVGKQPAVVGDVDIQVSVSVEAINNNWQRVINRLEREIDRFDEYGRNKTWWLDTIIPPCPAYDGWTIKLYFSGLEDMRQNLERLRGKIERICNDKRR